MLRVILVFMVLLVSSGGSFASTWRCGQELVKVGDASAEVLMKCGKPTAAEEAPSIRSGSFREKSRDIGEGRSITKGSFDETYVRVEHWYYDRGMHDFVYKLTFIGGVLANIKTMGYGGYLKEEEVSTSSAPPPPKALQQESEVTTGKVDIVGAPIGSRVYLNEYYAGNIPCTIEKVEPGSYSLSVRREGYREWNERILVKTDVTLWLEVYLEPEQGEKAEGSLEKGELRETKKLYKWTDAQGRIYITDNPPPGTE